MDSGPPAGQRAPLRRALIVTGPYHYRHRGAAAGHVPQAGDRDDLGGIFERSMELW